MTERDPDAERGDDETPGGARREPTLPPDEEAAWAQIVAAYGEEPADDPGPGPDPDSDSDSEKEAEPDAPREPDGDTLTKPGGDSAESDPPVRSFTVYAAGTGPRDWDGPDDEDEGHFVPPEPPPLPETDVTTKFAWLAVLGGPLLLLGAILFQVHLTWWIVTLGVGGFLGGFGTLIARMRDGRDDDDWDDPGRGAVV
ncbi:hypothetical protein GCM10009801_35540 [Streptomyces albiaxialis]|uniref:DUF308 domain-containing protein n=1 Tax=Streptomyces albiaxialis TaxID=329523 RepID=A0ABN2VZC5_9ACTN